MARGRDVKGRCDVGCVTVQSGRHDATARDHVVGRQHRLDGIPVDRMRQRAAEFNIRPVGCGTVGDDVVGGGGRANLRLVDDQRIVIERSVGRDEIHRAAGVELRSPFRCVTPDGKPHHVPAPGAHIIRICAEDQRVLTRVLDAPGSTENRILTLRAAVGTVQHIQEIGRRRHEPELDRVLIGGQHTDGLHRTSAQAVILCALEHEVDGC